MIHALAAAERSTRIAMGNNPLAFTLNLLYTLAGIITALISGIKTFQWDNKNYALIFKVRSFWWEFGYMKGARAMTIGHTILLGPKEMRNDLAHEIIHVGQYEKYPLIFPVLYYIELFRNGYRMNRFEEEAYTKSDSHYSGKWN